MTMATKTRSRLAAPVRANVGVEVWYRGKLECILLAMSNSMLLHIRAAFNRGEQIIGFADDADQSVLLKRALEKWGGLWRRKLNKLSLTLADQFADKAQSVTDRAVAKAFADAGFTVKFKATRGSKAAYRAVAAEQVNLIRSIPQQYLQSVQSAVWASVMKGADMAVLAKEIQKKYGLSKKRAALIARDQNHKAKAVMENERRKELGIEEAVWQHSGAGKEPRPEHVRASGKKYKLSEGMFLEGKWTFPGMEINCRCTSRAVIPGF